MDDNSSTTASSLYSRPRNLMCSKDRLRSQAWRELKKIRETIWNQHRPLSFGAIHYEEGHLRYINARISRVQYSRRFGTCHLFTLWEIQYFELACIMLLVYDPVIPRLGQISAIVQRKRISEEVRRKVCKICGISLSNGKAAQSCDGR